MAEYTIEYRNATLNDDTLESKVTDLANHYMPEYGDTFSTYFSNRWDEYELYTTDTKEWHERFGARLSNLCTSYLEKIKAYETKIGVLDGIVIKRATDNYDLPVKGTETIQPRVNPVSGYPTKSYDATVSGGQNTADIRNNYINKVRDLWLEFVEEFAPLFYQIY